MPEESCRRNVVDRKPLVGTDLGPQTQSWLNISNRNAAELKPFGPRVRMATLQSLPIQIVSDREMLESRRRDRVAGSIVPTSASFRQASAIFTRLYLAARFPNSAGCVASWL